MEIHWDYIVCLLGHHLNGFPPNSTRHHLNELGGQIGWKSIEITLYARLVELGGNPLRLHCMPVKGFRCQSNSTGQIGWKSIEITLYACLVELVKLGGNPSNQPGIISTDFQPIQPPNLTDLTRHHLNELGG